MSTTAVPGMVIVFRGDVVLMKVVVGRGGNLTKRFADAIRAEVQKNGEAPSARNAYNLAAQMGFGSKQDRAVITASRVIYDGDTPGLEELCRKNFQSTEFVPLWGPTVPNPPVETVDT
ncbi:MAG: hypothetical protein WC526_01135 [Patescibacteria group bacterium]